jgi:acetolactate synthase-1/2/3 large subunit
MSKDTHSTSDSLSLENIEAEISQVVLGSANNSITDITSANNTNTIASNSITQNVITDAALEEDCADYIVRYLEALEVEYVFGIPGGNIEPFYNALGRAQKRGTLKHVVARHESGAVFMAEGYYRETGKLGVVCTTAGPGATNAITGIACAYGNYAPILLITAQTCLPTFGRGAWQESSGATGADSVAMLDSITRYNSMISHPKQLVTQLDKAVMHAFGPTPGPVHLAIPRDIFTHQLHQPLYARSPSSLQTLMSIAPNIETLTRLKFLLKNAKNVVMVVGNYAKNCGDLILQLAEKNHWQFATSPGAKGYVPSRHSLSLGVYGVAGHDQAKHLLESPDCEVILSIGLECNEPNTCGWSVNALCSERLVQIADNFELLTSPSSAQMKIYAAPRFVLQFLLSDVELTATENRAKLALANASPVTMVNANSTTSNPRLSLVKKIPGALDRIKPQDLLAFLNHEMAEDTPVVMDIGNSFLWGIHYWNFRHDPTRVNNKNLFVIDNGMASMGWAIGAAIGIAFANPNVQVLCVTGDGACLMSGQELTVAVEHQLNIIFVVLNDACLGTVKHGQIMAGAEKIAFKLPRVDFAAMATAQGAKGMLIKSYEALNNLDLSDNKNSGPRLLDVWIDDNESPPLKTRIDALNTA